MLAAMKSRIDTNTVYSAVATRRISIDNMAWQVPILSLTAQAFLFNIDLGPSTTQFARTIAASLSIIVAGLSALLLVRHRLADVTDAQWLEGHEAALPADLRVHGQPWRDSRLRARREGFIMNTIPQWNALTTWVVGLLIFGLVSGGIILVTWLWPFLLDPNWPVGK